MSENLDRLADLLEEHSPTRLAVFWEDVMSNREAAGPETVSGRLKQAIADSGLSHYAIGKSAGVNPAMIMRFMSGARDLRLETVDRLAAALGLRLCPEDDAAPAPDRKPISPELIAKIKADELAYTAWLDNLEKLFPGDEDSEHKVKERSLFLEWHRREAALKVEFHEKLRELTGKDIDC